MVEVNLAMSPISMIAVRCLKLLYMDVCMHGAICAKHVRFTIVFLTCKRHLMEQLCFLLVYVQVQYIDETATYSIDNTKCATASGIFYLIATHTHAHIMSHILYPTVKLSRR